MKKAFTLAEIMIVLAVIGVLTAILLPVAFHSTPDENVMKFKKGHNALLTAIRELVNSDKYYLDGDLGKKVDGTDVVDTKYFCNTVVDILNAKEHDCPEATLSSTNAVVSEDWELNGTNSTPIKELIDERCKTRETEGLINSIIVNDGIVFYEAYPGYPFGAKLSSGATKCAYYYVWDKEGVDSGVNYSSGFYYVYKPFCMDVDGIGEGEDPFGYGIRVDGKVIFGARAEEWLQKSIQQ